MNIAIVVNSGWNVINFRKGLVDALVSLGHKVYIVTPQDGSVQNIKMWDVKYVHLNALSRKGKNPVKDLKLVKELKSIYRTNHIDVALQFTIKPNIYGSIAAGKLPTKTISTVTGLGYSFLKKGITHHLVKKLYKAAFTKTDLVVFQNEDDMRLFEKLGLVEQSKANIIRGSGIDTDYFKPSERERTKGPLVFLFVGRLLYDKGIREFVMAAKSVLNEMPDNVECKILGAPDTQNPSAINQADIDEWNEIDGLTYLGSTDNAKPFIDDCDVVVLPSYREGLPRVLLEGAAMEKPLIATDVPGCKDVVVHGENGFLVAVKDASALLEAMKAMVVLSVQTRKKMGQNGRCRVLELFQERSVVNDYLLLINEINN